MMKRATASLGILPSKSFLESEKPLREFCFNDYQAIFYVGGYGPVIDLAKDEVNIELANKVRPGRIRRPLPLKSLLVLPRREGSQCRMSWPCVSNGMLPVPIMTSGRGGIVKCCRRRHGRVWKSPYSTVRSRLVSPTLKKKSLVRWR